MKVVIIGGGISGLASAALLGRKGHSVTIFEKNDFLYGRAHVKKKDKYTFDAGPSWYLMPEVFERYFSLLDSSPSDYYNLKRLDPAYRVFSKNHNPITITGDLKNDSATFESLEKGAGSQLYKYIQSAEHIYKTSINDFLYTDSIKVRSILRKNPMIALRLLPLVTQTIDSYVSKRFHNQLLKQILEYPSVFLGASPFNTPALFHLMSYLDFKQGVFYPMGGMHKVLNAIESLARENGVKIHKSAEVESIETKNTAAVGVNVGGEIHKADCVISSADLKHSETSLLDNKYQTYPSEYWEKKLAGPSALLIYLGIKGKLPQLAHHNLYFSPAWKENFKAIFDDLKIPDDPSYYLCNPSKTDEQVAPKGEENVFVLVPLPSRQMTISSQEKLADIILMHIERTTGLPNLRKSIVQKEVSGPVEFSSLYNSWNSTALGLAHTLRQTAMFRPSVRSKKVSNLYYVGANVQPGIGLPMCLISAELVSEAIKNDYS